MGGVSTLANAAEIVPNATKVEEQVRIVHLGPGFCSSDEHPLQDDEICECAPLHVPPLGMCRNGSLSVSMSEGVHGCSGSH